MDVPEPAWENVPELRHNREEIKQGILHPSTCISLAAMVICFHFPLTFAELVELLRDARGESLNRVVVLMALLCPEGSIEALTQRLSRSSGMEAQKILSGLGSLNVNPTTELVDAILGHLCSYDNDARESAAVLLDEWLDSDTPIDKAFIQSTWDQWVEDRQPQSDGAVSMSLANLLAKLNSAEQPQ
ncbi:hypothetical protein D3C77_473710 [compost metagenome]